MTPLAPPAILARKRPIAIASMFAAELAWAFVVATPVHEWVRRAWGSHPDGDAVLFAPGGHDLLMWLGQEDAGLGVTTRTTLVLLAVGAVLLQLPFGALVASLAFGREAEPRAEETGGEAAGPTRALRLVTALQVGIGAWLPLAALLALSILVTVIVLSLGGIVASLVEHSLTGSLGDAPSFTVRLLLIALFAAVAAVLGVIIDLARAAVVREVGIASAHGESSPAWSTMFRGLRTAIGAARHGLGRATLGWAARAVVGLALVAIGYVAATFLGGRGGAALAGLFVVHQSVVLGRVALRASWMARALARIAPVQDEHEERRRSAL